VPALFQEVDLLVRKEWQKVNTVFHFIGQENKKKAYQDVEDGPG
jgi:hypothetical protein